MRRLVPPVGTIRSRRLGSTSSTMLTDLTRGASAGAWGGTTMGTLPKAYGSQVDGCGNAGPEELGSTKGERCTAMPLTTQVPAAVRGNRRGCDTPAQSGCA